MRTLSQAAPQRTTQKEKEIQREVVRLYRLAGCFTYSTSQARASHIALGLPDLYVMTRRSGVADGFWHETKRPGGKLRASQQGFIRAAEECGVKVVVGGVAEAVAHLKALGLVAKVGLNDPLPAILGGGGDPRYAQEQLRCDGPLMVY